MPTKEGFRSLVDLVDPSSLPSKGKLGDINYREHVNTAHSILERMRLDITSAVRAVSASFPWLDEDQIVDGLVIYFSSEESRRGRSHEKMLEDYSKKIEQWGELFGALSWGTKEAEAVTSGFIQEILTEKVWTEAIEPTKNKEGLDKVAVIHVEGVKPETFHRAIVPQLLARDFELASQFAYPGINYLHQKTIDLEPRFVDAVLIKLPK